MQSIKAIATTVVMPVPMVMLKGQPGALTRAVAVPNNGCPTSPSSEPVLMCPASVLCA